MKRTTKLVALLALVAVLVLSACLAVACDKQGSECTAECPTCHKCTDPKCKVHTDPKDKCQCTAEKQLVRIGVTTKPDKTCYKVGDTFDPTGMVVTAMYSDKTTEVVTGYTWDKTEPLKRSDKAVTVMYNGKVSMFSIAVSEKIDDKQLEIKTADNAVYTVEAESLDYSHCKNSNDQSRLPGIESCGTASNGLSVGGLSLAINYFGFTVESNVEADLTIVARAAAVSADHELDVTTAYFWNTNIIYSGAVLKWDTTTTNFFNWQSVYFKGLKLQKGTNEFVVDIVSGIGANYDCFYLIVNPTGEEEIPPKVEDKPVEPKNYEVFAEITAPGTYKVEAESLDYSDCKNSNNPMKKPSIETNGDIVSVGSLSAVGNRFGLKVSSTIDAKLKIVLRVANGLPGDQEIDKQTKITWGGQVVKTNHTLVWPTVWHQYENVAIGGLELKKGETVLEFEVVLGTFNFDYVQFIVTTDDDPTPTHECNSKCPECGKCTNKQCIEDACVAKCDCFKYSTLVQVEGNGEYKVEAEANGGINYSKVVGSRDENVESASGGSCRSSLSVAGTFFGFYVNSKATAKVKLTMRVSAGIPAPQNLDEILKITWNGVEVKTGHTCEFPEANYWFRWSDAVVDGLQLIVGENLLKIEIISGCPNIDYFTLEVTEAEIVQPEHQCESKCPVCGKCTNKDCSEEVCVDKCQCVSYDPIRTIETDENKEYKIEGEAVGGVNYTAAPGSRDEGTSNASNGLCRSSLGTKGNKFGFAVTSKVSTQLKIVMHVSAGDACPQNMDELLKITWNGAEVKTGHTCEFPEANYWFRWSDAVVDGLQLVEGKNQLVIEVVGNGCPNIDYFVLQVGEQKAPEHQCESKCSVCGKCTNKDCSEEVCADKCQCVSYDSIRTIETDKGEDYKIEGEAVGGVNYTAAPGSRDEGTSNASNGLCRSSLGTKGNKFGFAVTSKVSTQLKIVMHVSAGDACPQNMDELLKITWNGVEVKTGHTCEFPEANYWFRWSDAVLDNLQLVEGKNQLVIEVVGNGCPNIDYFVLQVNGGYKEEYATKLEIASNEAATYTVEAESLDYSKCKNFNNLATTPNFERPDSVTSNGLSVGSLGVRGNKFGFTVNSTVAIKNITLGFVVSSGNGAEQPLDTAIKITWNGQEITSGYTVPWNGSWHQWTTATISGLDLNQGDNVLVIEVLTSCPNWDCFTITVGAAE